MLTREMFEGKSFQDSKNALEEALGCLCEEVPVSIFTIHDPRSTSGRKLGVIVGEGKYASAAFLAALARGRPTFILSEEELAIAARFFSEYWQTPEGHPVIQFLQEIGVGAPIDIAWKGQNAFAREGALVDDQSKLHVEGVLNMLELGLIRAASKNVEGDWTAHPWVKQAILVALKSRKIEPSEAGALQFADKLPIQKPRSGVRVVPPGTIRRGACVEPGVIVMPGYVNIGAYVGPGSMVDTWATVGSCAQIGRNVHLAGGVGIGGVLEPPGAMPVVIEDGAFIGSRAIVVEGVIVETEAVLAAGVCLTASTPIIDMRGNEPKTLKGRVPARAIVVSGTRTMVLPAGEAQITCAYIIGTRTESTDRKVSLEAALREIREIGACV